MNLSLPLFLPAVRRWLCWPILCVGLLLARPVLHAQQTGSVDPRSGASLGLAGKVDGVFLQPDGKILVTGTFAGRLARLDPYGSVDTGFNPGTGADQGVDAVAVQPDGKIVIGGEFTTFDGVTRHGVARLNADGSVDTGFDPGTGAFFKPGMSSGSADVTSVAVQPDGKIIAGGAFNVFNGMTRNGLARLNHDGSLDTGFDPFNNTGVLDNAGVYVSSVTVQPDGRIVVIGAVPELNGTAGNTLVVRLNADGSVDASFDPFTGTDPSVFSSAVQPDGKIVISGNFTDIGGVAFNGLARLNADGSLDTGFVPGTGTNDFVTSVALQPDGKIILVGDFPSIVGMGVGDKVARLNTDGSVDSSLAPGTGFDETVHAAVVQPDGEIIVGGQFTAIRGVAQNGVARLYSDGRLDNVFQADANPGLNRPVYGVVLQPDGKLLVVGDFTTINGVIRNRVARLNADGSLDTGFDPGTGADETVSSVLLQPDGKMVILGEFESFNGVRRSNLARLNADGSLDTGFDPDGTDGRINAMALQPDGKLVVGGMFTVIDGFARPALARLNTDGSVDTGFDPDLSESPNDYLAVAVQPDGKIIVGGIFGAINGVTRDDLARLNANGSVDTSFDPGTGADGEVSRVAVQSDGKIVIAGGFTTIDGTARAGLARLNADGSVDTGFDPGTGPADDGVTSLTPQSDGTIIVGGQFTSFNGVARGHLARLNADGSLDATFLSGTGANNPVESVAVQADGAIIIGGDFDQVSGVVLNYVARLDAGGSVDPGFLPGGQEVVPTVSVRAKGDATASEDGARGAFIITREGSDRSAALAVAFKLKGAAKNGVDYKQIDGSAVIPAGAASVKVKIEPIDNDIQDGTRKVKLKLVASPTGAYTLGTATTAVVSILDND